MKNFYKELIFAVVIVLAYFFVLPSLLGWYSERQEMKSPPMSAFEEAFKNGGLTLDSNKPQYPSVVKNDSRPVCEKQSEIRVYQEWEKKCLELKGQKDCFLSKEESDKILAQKAFIVSQCNYPASN